MYEYLYDIYYVTLWQWRRAVHRMLGGRQLKILNGILSWQIYRSNCQNIRHLTPRYASSIHN